MVGSGQRHDSMNNEDTSSSASAVRREVLQRLLRIEEQGAYVGIGAAGTGEDWGARDERQSMEYVAGVTRWRRRLDFILDHFYRGDLEKMEFALRQILRIGLYDIIFLETPSYAAVSEAVNLAKAEVRRGAGGLVNGILRSVLRHRDALPEPDTGDQADDLGIRHSHPTWMVRRWLERYGSEACERLLEWNNVRPVYAVRANTLRITPDELRERFETLAIPSEPGVFLHDIIRTRTIQPLLRNHLLEDGLCFVQDEAAAMIVRLADPQPHERVLDVCAAPGGKAFLASQLMQDSGQILAVDVHEGRLRMVERGARKLGARSIATVAADMRSFRPREPFDRVILDAPCSGFGVLSKRADLRWNRRPEDLVELVALQDDLLDASAQCVRAGGILVYGTCTIEPEENEERIRAFLERHDDFVVEDAGRYVPRELVTEEGFYASLPFRDGVDGAFGVRMQRKT